MLSSSIDDYVTTTHCFSGNLRIIEC